MKNIFVVTFLFTQVLLANEIITCGKYIEIQKIKNCPENHYLKQFAYKYCLRFERTSKKLTAEGMQWSLAVKQCLLKEVMDNYAERSCKQIATSAFEQHVACYLENGYCHLPDSDKAKIFLSTLDSIIFPRTWVGIWEVSRSCN